MSSGVPPAPSAVLGPGRGVVVDLLTTDWRAWATALLLVPVLTYMLTTLANVRRKSASSAMVDGAVEPAMVPYALPFIGNLIPFAMDPKSFLTSLVHRFRREPVSVTVMGEHIYVVPPGKVAAAVLAHRDLSTKPLVYRFSKTVLGVPDKDGLDIIERDGSGIGSTPLPGFEDMKPAHRFGYNIHRTFHQYLAGNPMRCLAAHFIANFKRAALDDPPSNLPAVTGVEWTQFDDFYGWLKAVMFRSAYRAFAGDLLFEMAPTLTEDFWAFDAAAGTLFKRLPSWLIPEAHAARDKFRGHLERWIAEASKRVDIDDPNVAKLDWEPVFGHICNREAYRVHRDSGACATAVASHIMGLCWATNANVIPSTFWTLNGLLQQPDMMPHVVAAVDAAFSASGDLDIDKLLGDDLLNALYMESLRYSVATAPARMPERDDVVIGGYKFRKQATIISVSNIGANDTAYWNQGRALDPKGTRHQHPLDTFWPERFLQFPSEPDSGPLRESSKPELYAYRQGEQGPKSRTTADYDSAKVVTTGITTHFYPYGGGPKMCPGRFFAKQEMLAAVASLLHFFEFELVDPAAAARVGLYTSTYPFGSMAPDKPLSLRMRRRAF